MVNDNDLRYQQPAPWEDAEPRLWLRDNLMDYDSMAEFVFDTEEFAQTRQAVDDAINSASMRGDDYIDCGSDFAEWLWHNGGCYIQDFDAQDVLAWAIQEELAGYGFGVGEYRGRPCCIYRM